MNVGCIPSKALLDSSEHFHNATHTFKEHGIDISEAKVNFAQMIDRKIKVVQQMNSGVEFLMKKIRSLFIQVMVFLLMKQRSTSTNLMVLKNR